MRHLRHWFANMHAITLIFALGVGVVNSARLCTGKNWLQPPNLPQTRVLPKSRTVTHMTHLKGSDSSPQRFECHVERLRCASNLVWSDDSSRSQSFLEMTLFPLIAREYPINRLFNLQHSFSVLKYLPQVCCL